jgi:ligand-binding sensor domain-containing protein
MDGLNRFDGKNFTVFRNILQDTNSLINNIINDLYVDPQNRVWIATNGGLCYYSYQDQMFHRIDFSDSLEPTDKYRVYAIAGNQQEGIWFATKSKFHHIDVQTHTVSSYAIPSAPNLHLSEIFWDQANRLWIGTNQSKIYLFDPVSKNLKSGPINSMYSSQLNLTITSRVIQNFDGDTLLMGSWYGGLQKVYSKDQLVYCKEIINGISSDHKKNVVTGIRAWKNHQWWIATYGAGLFLYDGPSNRFIKSFRHQENNVHSLSNDYIHTILVDDQGILWIGNENGLDQYDAEANHFKLIKIETQTSETSILRVPSSMIENLKDSSQLWITISGIGLFTFDRNTAVYKEYPLSFDHQPVDKNMYCVYYDHHRVLWIGSRTRLYCFDPLQNKVWLPCKVDSMMPRGVHTILKDQNGKMWFATNLSGIYSYDEKESTWQHYTYEANTKNSLPDNRIFSMILDHTGKIWLGTQNKGLCSFDPSTESIVTYEYQKGKLSGLPDNNVYDLYEDTDYTIWIATENGLAALDKERIKIKSYHMEDGLSNNIIFSITPDHHGHVWLATNNGISDFDIKKNKLKTILSLSAYPIIEWMVLLY